MSLYFLYREFTNPAGTWILVVAMTRFKVRMAKLFEVFLQIGKIARLIRGDGEGRGVSLLVWNCGVDPRDDPEVPPTLYPQPDGFSGVTHTSTFDHLSTQLRALVVEREVVGFALDHLRTT